jgi:hypothetical protein
VLFPLTTVAQSTDIIILLLLDNLQVVRKYIREQAEISDEIFSKLNISENFEDTSLLLYNKKTINHEISSKNSST